MAEGKLGELTVEGNKWFSVELIKKFIHARKNDLLNIFTLQRDMVRLNQNPDLDVTAVLKPGAVPETADIALKATDKMPFHAGLSLITMGRVPSARREGRFLCAVPT